MTKKKIAKRRKAPKARRSLQSKNGTLIIVGGREDRQGERRILSEVAKRTGKGRLIVVTAASQVALLVWEEYERVFAELGVAKVSHLHIESTEEARNPKLLEMFDDAETIFFTGGDQLMITSKLGGTPIIDKIFEVFRAGGTVAGTSAGAAMMGETMLMGIESTIGSESHKVGHWMMAPGLGFIQNMIVDQHFAQRSRIGRLLRAVALNPGVLGIGIDEDTAIVIEDHFFRVIGSNAVYVIDGSRVTSTNISQATADRTMSMHDVRLHILASGELFNLIERHPLLTANSLPKPGRKAPGTSLSASL